MIEEAGRAIIRDQVASGGNALPWADRIAYARLMLERDLDAYRASQGLTFFDRGIPDVQGYLRLIGEAPLPEVEVAVRDYPYALTVFIAPPWKAIFAQDAERKQDFVEAARTCDAMREVYGEAGYTLVDLPLAPVAERVAFVRDNVTKR